MDCRSAHDAISDRLDGRLDDGRLDDHALDAHLGSCAACRAYAADAAALHRQVRLRIAEPVPDLTAAILTAIGRDSDHARTGSLRLGLAAVGVVQLVVALPALLLGEDAGLPAHTARHLGSFAVALAIGFLFAAWRPDRIGGVLPLTAVLVGCLLIGSAFDVAQGRTAALTELGAHATEIVGLGLLWVLARAVRGPDGNRTGRLATGPTIS
jgi:hypothetical protein